MTDQHTPAPDIVGWIDDLLLAAEDSLDELSSETRAHAFVRGSAFAYRRVRDRLADERSALKSPYSSDPSAIAGARERLGRTAWPVKDSGHPGASEASIADLRTLLADHARLEAENARLRETCQPFAKAWAMGCRVLRHNGKVHEVASRASLGLTEDGALQIGDFERLARALTNREGQDNG